LGVHRGGPSINARSEGITELLRAWNSGDQAALERLAERVYPELRLMARRYLKDEHQAETLQTTALVHEVYLCRKNSIYAQQRPVRMTFSGSKVATSINLGANTRADEVHLPVSVR
jgi:hypothetical protein